MQKESFTKGIARIKWFAAVAAVLSLVILAVDLFYIRPTLRELLFNLHGLLFDVIVLGGLLAIYEYMWENGQPRKTSNGIAI